jgi:starch-binding outer membrane protein, SusD/RagB family
VADPQPDANKAVLDWASTTGIHLITDQGVDYNYTYVWDVHNNPEIIFAATILPNRGGWQWPWTGMDPYGFMTWTWWMGSSMPMNFLKLYEKTDGAPQIWDPVGGEDLWEKLQELDSRFHQSTAAIGSYWNSAVPLVNSWVGGGRDAANRGGTWITKTYPASITPSECLCYSK